jgi:uncharacterized coiled-coil protein SlyX
MRAYFVSRIREARKVHSEEYRKLRLLIDGLHVLENRFFDAIFYCASKRRIASLRKDRAIAEFQIREIKAKIRHTQSVISDAQSMLKAITRKDQS